MSAQLNIQAVIAPKVVYRKLDSKTSEIYFILSLCKIRLIIKDDYVVLQF